MQNIKNIQIEGTEKLPYVVPCLTELCLDTFTNGGANNITESQGDGLYS